VTGSLLRAVLRGTDLQVAIFDGVLWAKHNLLSHP
jgi:hypothetical protein